ncbi:hypothetical protein [Runella sp.]|uniref:hypothetical protein n=1 Tax=Runella sp. TaxID=1960881 RepID=UPI003D13BAD3
MKMILKFLLIGAGFALTLILIWFCLVYDFRGEKILVPSNYNGTFLIFYNVDDGEEKVTDGYFGRIILKIPPSGVLAVNFKDYLYRNTPLQNRDYYLYDPSNGKILDKLANVEGDLLKYSNGKFELKSAGHFVSLDSLNKRGEPIREEGFLTYAQGFSVEELMRRKNSQREIDGDQSLKQRTIVYKAP